MLIEKNGNFDNFTNFMMIMHAHCCNNTIMSNECWGKKKIIYTDDS